MKRLENKIAIVYGDGGIGSAIAKVFAVEGAKVFLVGRTAAKLKTISKEIGDATMEGWCLHGLPLKDSTVRYL